MEKISALLAICEGNPPMDYPHKGQWRGALMFSLICAWMNGRENNIDAVELRCHRAHYDVTVMKSKPNFVINIVVATITEDQGRYLKC